MRRVLAATVLVGITATGCAGSDSTKASVQPTPTPSPTASALTSIGAGVLSADCLKAAQAYSKSSAAFSAGMSKDLSTQFRALAAQLRAFQDNVPAGAVREAFQTLSEVYADLADKLKGVTYVPSAGAPPPAAYLAAIRDFSSPRFAAAAGTIGTYFANQCKS